ncbi:MAG TPA: SAM-dependent chlorinase/fluorinase [Candidatus Limnocylindria bacterium]|nr:SAM-dependent chlorinase/fluorinase [Candidatus Limnocylindria bacterium]
MARPVITLLTDFGLDGAAAICRGVMLGICPDAQIVDVAHTIRKYAIGDGAFILRIAAPYMPQRTTHVAVVDPGVGTERRPVALRTARGDVLVGPDNGLLIAAAEALGGIAEARVLENRALWLPSETSSTFHGRDIFSPVAAHLAAGDAAFEEVGPALRAEALVRLAMPATRARSGVLDTAVAYIDSFGNLRTAATPDDLERAIGQLEDGTPLIVEFFAADGHATHREATQFGRTFGRVPAGSSLVYVDSDGDVAFADNQGNAARRLGIATGAAVRISNA